MELKIEQSGTELHTPTAGLDFIGHAINQATTLRKTCALLVNATAFPTLISLALTSAYWRWGKVILKPWKTSGMMAGSNTVWVSRKCPHPAVYGKDLMKTPSPSIP